MKKVVVLFIAVFLINSSYTLSYADSGRLDLICDSNVENLDFGQAVERRLWAYRCFYDTIGKEDFREASGSPLVQIVPGKYGYPTFATVNGNDVEVYHAPVDRFAPCELPKGVTFFKLCPL